MQESLQNKKMKKHTEETTSYILKYNYLQMSKNIQVHRWKNSNLSTTQSEITGKVCNIWQQV